MDEAQREKLNVTEHESDDEELYDLILATADEYVRFMDDVEKSIADGSLETQPFSDLLECDDNWE